MSLSACESAYYRQGVLDSYPFIDSANRWYNIPDKSNIIQPKKDQPRYAVSEIIKIADNILLYQRANGGWPRNYDMLAILTPEQEDCLIKTKNILHTTFENFATFSHIEYLSQIYTLTQEDKYKDAALRGIEFLLTAQYPNGGWPQSYPIEQERCCSNINFNNTAYIGVMNLLKKIIDDDPDYTFVNKELRKRVNNAFEKGLDCILKCQIMENGKLVAWGQQYDNIKLTPTWGRTFEPPCICNSESADIVLFLMCLRNPSPEIIHAVKSAVAWFESSKIQGIRIRTIQTGHKIATSDRIVVKDPLAPAIWTRYYELGNHRPLFCDRNSKFLYKLSDVSHERRIGYGWYTYRPQEVLDKYSVWLSKHP